MNRDDWSGWLPVLIAAPVLTLPTAAPRATVAVLAVTAALMVLLGPRRQLATPIEIPWMVLIVAVTIGAYQARFVDLMLPKFAGFVLGALALRALLLTVKSARRVRILTAAYLVVGWCTAIVAALTSPDWKGKIPWLHAAATTLPRLAARLPGTQEPVNANPLGCLTLFFLPLLVMLFVSTLRPQQGDADMTRLRQSLLQASCLFGGLTLLLVLMLSQSRTSWVSAGLTAFVLLAWRYRVARLAGIAAGASILFSAWWMGVHVFTDDRSLIWSKALDRIAAHPLVGVGLGSFRQIVQSMNGNQPIITPHAHNTFLQVALDSGIPGLIAYAALLILATFMTWQVAAQSSDAGLRSLGIGLWASLLAVHLFGITDAIALGAKIGLFFWWNLGLIGALHGVVTKERKHSIENLGKNFNRVGQSTTILSGAGSGGTPRVQKEGWSVG